MCFSNEVVDNYICTTRIIHHGAIACIDSFLPSSPCKILLILSEDVLKKFMRSVDLDTFLHREVSLNFQVKNVIIDSRSRVR